MTALVVPGLPLPQPWDTAVARPLFAPRRSLAEVARQPLEERVTQPYEHAEMADELGAWTRRAE